MVSHTTNGSLNTVPTTLQTSNLSNLSNSLNAEHRTPNAEQNQTALTLPAKESSILPVFDLSGIFTL